MNAIAYYITAHGYGHGARSCDILNALHAMAPEIPIIVKTDLPEAFFRYRLPSAINVIKGAFDVGLIQKDSIQIDLEASLSAVQELYAKEEALTAGEMAFFREHRIAAVVADIPAIPLAAAQRAGIPSIATGNFGWDWIYADLAGLDERWMRYADRFRAVYRKTDLLLRQPFAEPMSAFPHQIDLPLLAKPGVPCRNRIAEQSGADPDKPWVLLSFTSLDLDSAALENLSNLKEYELFSVEPMVWPGSSIHGLSRALASFSDLLASMDIVLTKPGFGIISDCIANNKPIIHTDRAHFCEYPILVEAIEQYCRHAFIPGEELYAGQLLRSLQELKSAPAPATPMARGGAEKAAREILQRMG